MVLFPTLGFPAIATTLSSGERRFISSEVSAAANPVELEVSPICRLPHKNVAAVSRPDCDDCSAYAVRRRVSHRTYPNALHPGSLHKTYIQEPAAHAPMNPEPLYHGCFSRLYLI